jgi:two-component system response regulator HydG
MNNLLRILVVDDDMSMAKTLVDILKVKGYLAEAAYSGSDALEKIMGGQFNCVISDVILPGMNGVDLYKTIKTHQPELPVILMTAYSTDKLVQEGKEEGALACLKKPLDINALLTFFSSLSEERTIAIVDDDPQFCHTIGDILRTRGFTVTQITDPQRDIDSLGVNEQILLLDMRLDRLSGLDVLRKVREQHPSLPVILVTGYREEMASAIKAALEINAYTCLYKPLQIEELLETLSEVRRWELSRILEPHE